MGRPVQAYDAQGGKVWEAVYDIYGGLRNIEGGKGFIPFRQAGQYEDNETGLYYNRFRYYSPQTGSYLSKDPIGLEGNNPNSYAYVYDSNMEVDVFGLSIMDDSEWLSKVSAPNEGRHKYSRIKQGGVTKAKNTVILPDIDIKADVEGIRKGQATRVGETFEINNRIYGAHADTGRLYPISGDGFVTLDSTTYKALGVYRKLGEKLPETKLNEILNNMGVSPEQKQQAFDLWKTNEPKIYK
ncbi:RHS repeat-associated core domain-containing protein [Apibacter raozihei]|uniref:RHS repeat domain-containing protein n=1 Tax=Apibacter raozihei TaxID=2500547 RepID=UPI000FE42AAE|nr:RHS repeat-associated core domain-containing protein [Apibacter raozihei]